MGFALPILRELITGKGIVLSAGGVPEFGPAIGIIVGSVMAIGHTCDGHAPDNTNDTTPDANGKSNADRWNDANEWTKPQVKKWKDKCC
jgi:hypothetical protein